MLKAEPCSLWLMSEPLLPLSAYVSATPVTITMKQLLWRRGRLMRGSQASRKGRLMFLVFLPRSLETLPPSPLTLLLLPTKIEGARWHMESEVKGNGCGRWQNRSSCHEEASEPWIPLVGGQYSLFASKGNTLVNSHNGSPQHGKEAGEEAWEWTSTKAVLWSLEAATVWSQCSYNQSFSVSLFWCSRYKFQRGVSDGIVFHHVLFHCLERVELLIAQTPGCT